MRAVANFVLHKRGFSGVITGSATRVLHALRPSQRKAVQSPKPGASRARLWQSERSKMTSCVAVLKRAVDSGDTDLRYRS